MICHVLIPKNTTLSSKHLRKFSPASHIQEEKVPFVPRTSMRGAASARTLYPPSRCKAKGESRQSATWSKSNLFDDDDDDDDDDEIWRLIPSGEGKYHHIKVDKRTTKIGCVNATILRVPKVLQGWASLFTVSNLSVSLSVDGGNDSIYLTTRGSSQIQTVPRKNSTLPWNRNNSSKSPKDCPHSFPNGHCHAILIRSQSGSSLALCATGFFNTRDHFFKISKLM